MSRRSNAFAGTIAAVIGVLGTAAVHAQSDPPRNALRLGFLTVRTGALAAGGRQMEEGIQLFLKERQSAVAGRKVELFIADTGGNPAGAKTKVQELVEHDQVDVIIGPLATFEALAIDDYIKQSHVPLITPTSAAQNDLAQKKSNDYVIHAVGTAAQPMHVLGEYAARKLGIKRVATIADDFTYGHEGEAGFQHAYEDNGGKVVQKLWSPLNAIEYGSFVGQIKPDVDAVYAGFAGVNGMRFLRQFNEYGLKSHIAVLGNPTCVDEGVLKNMGDEALGVVTASWYAATIDTPENQRFVQAVNDEYKAVPGFYTAGTYTAGLVLEEALRAIQGRFEDKAAFVKALHSVRLTHGPMGPIRLDEFGKPILNIYVRRVERRKGVLVNAIVDTVADVSQFGKYDPAQFLASPPYSRDYPVAKNLE
jgi:branched-chain amino acid transport system substrate-binding protein